MMSSPVDQFQRALIVDSDSGRLEHLKMMRLLLLCLLLPTATAYSEDREDPNGSGYGDADDDDVDELFPTRSSIAGNPDKATGEDNDSGQITLIVIVVAVVVVALSVAAVITYILVKRRMNKQQQGIYTVPIDQDKKEAV